MRIRAIISVFAGLFCWSFWDGGPGIGLTLCGFVVYSTRRFISRFAITSLGEERANLSAFRMFDRFVLVWICRFPLPLDIWEGLRFVFVALPGLFSYLFVPVVVLFLRFSVLLALRLPRLRTCVCRECVCVGGGEGLVRLFDLRLFGFVCFLLFLVSGKSCGLTIY